MSAPHHPSTADRAATVHDRRRDALIWAFVILGVALRLFHYLRDPSIWHDEAALVLNVLNKGFSDLLGPLLFAEASPPLFLCLERAAVLLGGDSTFAVRLWPLLASCAAVVLMVPLARRLLQPRAVPWAVLLLAVSDRLLWHASEAKPYSLDVLAAIALPLLFFVSEGWRPVRRLILFAALAPITIFLVYPGCFLYGGLLVALLPMVVRERGWQVKLTYGVLAVAVFAAFAVLLVGPIRAQRCDTLSECWAPTFPNLSRPWTLPGWAVWSTVRIADYCCRPVGGALAGLGVIGVICLRRRRPGTALVLLLVPSGLAAVAALIRAYPYFGARVMVYAAPAVCLLVAEGVPPVFRWLRRRRAGLQASGLRKSIVFTAQACLLITLLVPASRTAFRVLVPWERPDVAGATDYVLSHRQPNDAVVASSWEHLYYFRHLGAALTTPGTSLQQPASRIWVVVTSKGSRAERLEIAQGLSPGDRQTLTRREFDDTTVLLTERNGEEVRDAAGTDYRDRESDAFPSFFAALRAMRAATYPPLKPLSMFTTTTLAEQLFSMVSRGATPENAAP
jgi:hypothetical protein